MILRGRYHKSPIQCGFDWMLATSFTTDPSLGTVNTIVAHDQWTGQQVHIDHTSKQVVRPTDFPLDFTVNGYQPVTVN